MNKSRVREFILQPPIAAMLINIVGVRGGTKTVPIHPPEQPSRRCRRAAPRRMDPFRRVEAKRAELQASETGAEHVLPKIHPGWRAPAEKPAEQLPQYLGAPP